MECKWKPPPAPLVDESAKIEQKHDRTTLHVYDLIYDVRHKYVNGGLSTSQVYINYFSEVLIKLWPGMVSIEQSRGHSDYLRAVFKPDPGNSRHSNLFERTAKHLSMSKHSLGVSLQDCGYQDTIYILANRLETTGFGEALGKAEMGLFAIPYS